MRCFNPEDQAYQKLQKASGLSEFKLRAFVSQFYDKHGKFPELDQIPGADSEAFIKEKLEAKSVGKYTRVTTDKVLQYTGAADLKEAQHKLNNEFRDKNISILDKEDGTALIKISKRASIYGDLYERGNLEIPDTVERPDSVGILTSMVSRLNDLYGIPMHAMSTVELNDKFKTTDPQITQANAFVYNGEVYINTDYASVDAPLHEFMHLIIGQIKSQDRKLYDTLLQQVTTIPGFEDQFDLYNKNKNRSFSDITEEILVTEYAKFITDPFYDGMFNFLNENTPQSQDFFYNITRAIDNVLIPQQSSASIKNQRILADSALNLAKKLGGAIMIPERLGSLDNSAEHRRLQNIKRSLLEDKIITQDCK